MGLIAFIQGIFAIAESVPIIRDALYGAIDAIIAKRVENARINRGEGYQALEAAKTPEEAARALSLIVRSRPR